MILYDVFYTDHSGNHDRYYLGRVWARSEADAGRLAREQWGTYGKRYFCTAMDEAEQQRSIDAAYRAAFPMATHAE